MIPFLKNVAQAYIERYDDLSEFCFLFPNKRSGTFFRKYLEETMADRVMLSPTITGITEFIADLTGLVEVPKVEALFILYKSYLQILNNENPDEENLPTDFDSFRYWGEMVLNDFNTIDQYLIDPDEIFKNLRDYREIATDFLTEEQKEVIEEYFGQSVYENSEGFWKQFNKKEDLSGLKSKFLNLWQILPELYKVFSNNLKEKNYASNGGLYRIAFELIKKEGEKLFDAKKIIIVGFNALNGAERGIFNELKKMKVSNSEESFADFLWDFTGPVLTQEDHPASKFVISNIKRFPMPEWITGQLERSNSYSYPEIRIIGSPSNAAQMKIAGELLNQQIEKEGKEGMTSAETVLVLPDEQLLIPTLYSVPEKLGDVNLTMGYPFRETSTASYIVLLKRLYSNMRISGGERIFFNKDLKLLLSHPYSYVLYKANSIDRLIGFIGKYHKVSVSLNEISKYLEESETLMNFPDKKSVNEQMFEFLEKHLRRIIEKLECFHNIRIHNNLEKSCIEKYLDDLNLLQSSIEEYSMKVSPMEVLRLTDKIVSRESISFEGEPLKGLQIMGTLETRALDFKTVYITSMNEGYMPRRARTQTFIPETIRRGYGLPPARYSEEIFAYYFIRLLSRAEKVFLIYDSRMGSGIKGGESRYLLYLEQFGPKEKISKEIWNYNLQNPLKKSANVVKTEAIKKVLKRYEAGCIEKPKNFSSSSLNSYRECQIKFFYRHIVGLNPDPEPGDFIDAITIGKVLHDTLMELYLPSSLQKTLLTSPVVIDPNKLEDILNNDSEIWKLVVRNINKIHYNRPKNERDHELEESSMLIGQQIAEQIKNIIRHDTKLAPFELYGCEIKEEIPIEIKSGRKVNFSFAIDRLDMIKEEGKPRLRIVDYKTGARKRKVDTFEEVIKGDYRGEQVFQLFTYAWLLNKKKKEGSENVMTEIYYVPDLLKNERGFPEIGGSAVSDYSEISDEFSKGIEEMIEEIFTSEAFVEPEDEKRCLNCPYNRICGK